jgi:hypothetical protein
MRKVSFPLILVVLLLGAFAQVRAQECGGKRPVYVGQASWFINHSPVVFKGRKYAKYGLPRVLNSTDVVPIGKYKKVGVFAEPKSKKTPEVIYLLVREGCEFQPYQITPPAPPRKKVKKST